MNVAQIINKKLIGDPLSNSELEFVILSYIENKIDDAQMANFLKSIKKNGMSKNETIALTRIMIESGETINFSQNKSFIADKHSTGGIG
ncbi:MAG: pyrimidine-nucleoside phosphorylase, partial [Candidatus Neomarinimicrobiota bacterium]|nr:pyrimidine-nucleoside phosphorylase [Candidatus Neomarinimicrobiota bacterium]